MDLLERRQEILQMDKLRRVGHDGHEGGALRSRTRQVLVESVSQYRRENVPCRWGGSKSDCPRCWVGVQVCVPMADYRWACVRGTHFKQEAFHSLSLARSANQSSSLHQYRHPPSPVKFNAERAVACHAEYAPDIQLGIFFIRTVIRVLTIRTWGNPTYSP